MATSTLTAEHGIPYRPGSLNPRHTVSLHLPSTLAQGLIVFVHGGAWRSSSPTDPTLAALPSLVPPEFALAIPGYRLSDQKAESDGGHAELNVRHPTHVLDVLEAVEWLVAGAGGRLDEKARSNVWVAGHSCGAHIISHLLLAHPAIPRPSVASQSAIKGYLFSEGIFDIDDLILEYPPYEAWFIRAAFGSPPYTDASPPNPASPYSLPPIHPPPSHILISQSPKDELISPRQSLAMIARLTALGLGEGVRYEGHWLGQGEEDGGHDELLGTQGFGRLLKDWVGRE